MGVHHGDLNQYSRFDAQVIDTDNHANNNAMVSTNHKYNADGDKIAALK